MSEQTVERGVDLSRMQEFVRLPDGTHAEISLAVPRHLRVRFWAQFWKDVLFAQRPGEPQP